MVEQAEAEGNERREKGRQRELCVGREKKESSCRTTAGTALKPKTATVKLGWFLTNGQRHMPMEGARPESRGAESDVDCFSTGSGDRCGTGGRMIHAKVSLHSIDGVEGIIAKCALITVFGH